ncbi:hypothetical protein MMC25_005773 [Agyrium rufum]|nr:hypothetical protein [Agyrium rufum]
MKFLVSAIVFSLTSLTPIASSSKNPSSSLQFSVYHTDSLPIVYPPFANLTFSPISVTLIQTPTSAVLVDTPISASQTYTLIKWIRVTIPNKRLTTLYITHGHGDHFFGMPLLRAAFPGLHVVATAPTIEHIEETLSPAAFPIWEGFFPGQIPDQDQDTSFLQALPADGIFKVDGHVFQAVEVGETDTWNTTVLHVPDIGLVVAGDAVYGHYYQYLGDSNTTALQNQWLKALDKIAVLEPRAIVPGHMDPKEGYSMDHLRTTKDYILAWQEEVLKAKSEEELVQATKSRYPDRLGEFILRFSASALTKFQ